ncbi:MAG: hypothetical protein O3B84_06870, partial [Chloroflexi bacterium]|nr:hypothetical protein [Chloroflexota bacterium]
STQYGVDVVEGQDTLSVEDAFANIGPGIMAGGLDSASNVLPRAVSAVAGVTGALSLDSTLTVLDGLSYESPYPTPTPVIEPVRFAPYLFSGPSNFIYENESFY